MTRTTVRGEGRLAAAVRRRLDGAAAPGLGPGLVTVDDSWTDAEPDPGLAWWLPVRVELGTAVIGPVQVTGRRGCVRCAKTRRERALGPGSARAELVRRHADRLATRPTPLVTAFAVAAVAEIVADLVARAGEQDVVTMVGLATLTVDAHPFLPDPACPSCGGLPDNRPPALMAEPRPKLSPAVYRVKDLDSIGDLMERAYVDGHTGVVRQLDVRTDYRYPMVSAPLYLPGSEEEAGFGRGLDYRGCARTSLAEAMERLGGARPGGSRTVVHAPYRAVAAQAICPLDLGLYPDERYAEPGFPYPPFDPDLPLPWVWGHSFARDEPVLVPEDYAYYRTHHTNPAARPLAYEVSNGCAIGGCLEEAALHGLIELAERDAFLLTWYARLAVPRVDLSTVEDRRISLLVERIRQESGHEVLAFATPGEHGIPTSWVMAVHTGADEPAAICAAGAHFDPEQAVLNGLLELTANLGWNRDAYLAERERVAGMVDDPEQVREMRDHALLYCHPGAFDRFSFLLREKPVPLAEAFARADCRPRFGDLRDDLAHTVERFTKHGLDVIVVDQTTDEHRVTGLACVKVIVPGLLPMTFGHRMRRTHGLPRLSTLPAELGYRGAGPNPHPHPFP